jgi:hypothetical protein
MGKNKKPYNLHESQQVKEVNLAVSTVLNFVFGIYFELCFLNFGFYYVIPKNTIC